MHTGRAVAVIVIATIVATTTACGGHSSAPRTARVQPKPTFLLSGQPRIEFGTIKKITPLGAGYKIWFSLGVILDDATGVQACTANKQCAPGTNGFLDDVSRADLKYVLPYYVAQTAPVVLLWGDIPIRCTARDLYEFTRGNTKGCLRSWMESYPTLDAVWGWWIKINPVPVESQHPTDEGLEHILRLEQQYHP